MRTSAACSRYPPSRRAQPGPNVIGQPKVAQGLQPGYCVHVEPHQVAMFRGNSDKMQALLAQAAESDRQNLRAELASIGALGRGALH